MSALRLRFGTATGLLTVSGRQNVSSTGDVPWEWCIHWPMEAAIPQMNSALVELLFDVGADFNKGIRRAYARFADDRQKKTMLDAAREICDTLETYIEEMEADEAGKGDKDKFAELAALPRWQGALGARLLKMAEDEVANPTRQQWLAQRRNTREHSTETKLVRLHRALEWNTRLVTLLEENGAKTWKELHPDEPPSQDQRAFFRMNYYKSWRRVPELRFLEMLGPWGFSQIGSHQVASFEELFQACCDGDNAKIEQMCLPKDGKADKPLLQITSQYGDNPWGESLISLQKR